MTWRRYYESLSTKRGNQHIDGGVIVLNSHCRLTAGADVEYAERLIQALSHAQTLIIMQKSASWSGPYGVQRHEIQDQFVNIFETQVAARA